MVILFFLAALTTAQMNVFEYAERYNRESESPQSVWAQVTLYYSSPDDIRPQLLDSFQSDLVRVGLENSDSAKEAIRNINDSLQEETLLLFSLLLEPNQEAREEIFDAFYRNSNSTGEGRLFRITEAARDGRTLSPDELNISEFHFSQFLIFYYLSNNRLADRTLFSSYVNYWEDRFSRVEFDPFMNELFRVTLSKAAYEENRYSVMYDIFDENLELPYIPPSLLKRNIYLGVDYAFYSQGRVDRSLRIQRELTLPLINYLDDRNGRLITLISQAGYLTELGSFQEAREVYQELLQNMDLFSERTKTRIFNNLSIVYYNTGETDAYVQTQLRALDLAQSVGNTEYQDEIYRNLHFFYRKYRNWDLAAQYLDLAEQLAVENDNKNSLIAINISRALFEKEYLNNLEEALRVLNETESLIDEDVNYILRDRVLKAKADIYLEQNNWLESERLLNQILESSASNSNTANYLQTLVNLAQIQAETGRISQAADKISEFRTYDTSVLPFRVLVYANTVSSHLEYLRGNVRKAGAEFSELIDIVFERARNTSDIESGYWNLESEYIYLFETYADFLIGQDQIDKAINLLDRVRTINDASLTDSPLVQASRLNDEELLLEKNLSDEMDRLRRQLVSATGQERLQLKNQIEQLSAQRRSLLRQYSGTPDYQELKIWNIKRNLNPGQVLVHITEINSHYYIAFIERERTDIAKLEVTDNDRVLFERALSSIITGETNLVDFYEIGQFLGMDELYGRYSSFIVIPDGYMYQLPLAVMPVAPPDTPFSYGSAEYLIETADIYMLNSLRDLTRQEMSASYEYDFAGFGVADFKNEQTGRNLVSLPRAPQEVRRVTNELNRFEANRSFTNESATARDFREIAGKSRILHMATHSEVSDSDPLFSTLHFYADSDTEGPETVKGQLFAYELFDLDLRNELVMLNSCESGGDRYLQGTGIMGINRALRYAGVKSLVLNTWSVNDHYAAEFAELFYEYLNRGLSKSESLQRAKVDFIKTKNANPHFWGPYVLNGDNRPLLRRESDIEANTILAIAFLLAISVVAGRKRLPQERV
ncbi:MAG: CHAT domain-containing protein [Balneolaceae bacterium]|nr:CHAT domain-containing protein [Balneolaceae bacterium]